MSYLKTITSRHVPDALLPWTSHIVCHGACHRGVRDLIVAGGAAGCVRPVAPLLVPLRMVLWRDTAPAARDIEDAVRQGEADAAAASAAAAALLSVAPPPPPGLAELRHLGLGEAPPSGFTLPPPAVTASTRASLLTAVAETGSVVVPDRLIAVRPLNSFCFSPEVRPGAAALSRARARLAMPGSDVTPAEDAARLFMPVCALELGSGALRAGGHPLPVSNMQQLAVR